MPNRHLEVTYSDSRVDRGRHRLEDAHLVEPGFTRFHRFVQIDPKTVGDSDQFLLVLGEAKLRLSGVHGSAGQACERRDSG